jgi:hypothetical protein
MPPTIVRVLSPNDASNPFPPEMLAAHPAGAVLAYHGTGKFALDSILREGFLPHEIPGLLSDVKRVSAVFDEYLFGGLRGHKHGILALGFLESELRDTGGLLRPYFSGLYSTARNYAILPGGESTAGLVGALADLQKLASDPDVLKAHRSYLERQLRGWPREGPEWTTYRDALDRSDEKGRLAETWLSLEPLRDKYAHRMTEEHIPVVIAISGKPEWFYSSPKVLGPNVPAVAPIPPERILGVAELPTDSVSVPVDGLEYMRDWKEKDL